MDEEQENKEQEWPFENLIAVVPIASSGFAFAFVVGYFLAFDISWFPFFSLSEHVVFALRALPIAIGASVALLIALIYPELRDPWILFQGERHWFAIVWIGTLVLAVILAYWTGLFAILLCMSFLFVILGSFIWMFLQDKDHWLAIVWIGTLVLAGILALSTGLFALCMSFLLVALGSFIHHYKMRPVSHRSLANILYWTIMVMVVTLMAGYLSAHSWKAAWEIDKRLNYNIIPLARASKVQFTQQSGMDRQVGQVLFVGSVGVLFYGYKSGTVHLFRWESIQEISECLDVPSC